MKLFILVLVIFVLIGCYNQSAIKPTTTTNNNSVHEYNRSLYGNQPYENQSTLNTQKTLPIIQNNTTPSETYEQKIARYTEEIRRNPNDADLYFRRGYIYGYMNEYPMDELRESILGLFASLNENWDLSIADYERALRINPNHNNARKYLETARQRKR